MDSDRDLLVAVLAVQLGFVSAGQVMAHAAAWATDRTRGLAERLKAELSEEQIRLLDTVVEGAIDLNAGDVKKTLDSLAAPELLKSFGGELEPPSSVEPVAADPESELPILSGGRYVGGEDESGAEPTEIGRGGIGRVLIAFDKKIGRQVAIKELLPSEGGSQSHSSTTQPREARFLREARVTGQLEHPGIVPVYEIGRRENGALCYTMKLVRGRTLGEALSKAKTVSERLELLGHFTDVCHAVAYAHSRGVIHRDIKPDNVMVGEFGETVVLDWGLAKLRGKEDIRRSAIAREVELFQQGKEAKTLEGQALGTPAYMSPEQAEGNVEDMDARSDVWSLGAMLFEILTGAPPFVGRTPFEILGKVLADEVATVESHCEEAPPELASIVAKALQREKSRRYASALDLVKDVERFQSGARVGAHAYSPTHLLRRFVARNRVAFVVGALAVVALMALGVASYFNVTAQRDRAVAAESLASEQRDQAVEAKQEAVNNLAEAFAEKAVREAREGSAAHAALFAAKALALQERPDARGVLVELANRKRPRVLWQSKPGAQCLDLRHSPDGKLLACASLSHRASILVWDLSTGRELVAKPVHEGATAIAWSSDSKTLYVAHGPQSVAIFDVASGTVRQSPAGQSPITGIVVASEKEVLLGDSSGTLRTLDRSTFEVRAQKPIEVGLQTLRASAENDLLATTSTTGKVVLFRAGQPVGQWATHPRPRTSLAFSPDGGVLAYAAPDHSVRLVSTKTQEEIRRLEGHGRPITAISFSSDSKTVAIGDTAGQINTFAVTTGTQERTLRGHAGPVWGLSFSPVQRVSLASAGADGSLRLWDTQTGRAVRGLGGHTNLVYGVAVSADGTTVVGADWGGSVVVYDARSGRVRASLSDPERNFWSVAVSSDGRRVAAGGARWTGGRRSRLGESPASVSVWEVETQKEILRVQSDPVATFGVAFAPDGRSIMTSGVLGTREIEIDTRKVTVLSPTKHVVAPVAIGRSGKRLLVSNDELSVALIDRSGRVILPARRMSESQVRSFSISPDGRHAAISGLDRYATVVRLSDFGEVVKLEGHTADVRSIAFLGSEAVVTGSADGTGRVWDLPTGRERARLVGHAGKIYSVGADVGGTVIATGSRDQTVRAWAVDTQARPAVLRGHQARVVSLSPGREPETIDSTDIGGQGYRFSLKTGERRTAERVAYASADGGRRQLFADVRSVTISAGGMENTFEHDEPIGRAMLCGPFALTLTHTGRVRVFSIAEDRLVRTEALGAGTLGLTCTADGRIAASGSHHGGVRVWRLGTNETLAEGQVGIDANTLALNPDGTLLAAAGSDPDIVIFDVQAQALARRLRGHSNWILGLAFSPDGRRLASASTDTTVRLWDPHEGRELARFFGHDIMTPLHFSADGQRLLAVLEDFSIRIYELDVLDRSAADMTMQIRQTYGVVLQGLNVVGDPELYETRFEAPK